jgi:hypothetical protein
MGTTGTHTEFAEIASEQHDQTGTSGIGSRQEERMETGGPPSTNRTADGSAVAEVPEWVTLDDDEEIIWIATPSRWTYVGVILSAVLGSIVALVIAFNGSVDVYVGPLPFDYLLLYVLPIAATPTLLYEIESRNTKYVLTTKQVWYKSGILTEYTNPIRLENVTTIEYDQTYKERLCSVGDIYVSTAGTGGYDMVLQKIPDPAPKSSLIMEYQDRQ